jgi:peptidoglycan/LPS O-acetylase OafA/YrhL
MMSLERSQTAGVSLFTNFYIRRFFRIYPLSAACVLVVFATHLNLHQSSIYHVWTWKELLANLLLIQNLVYVKDMIFVLWSLPLEVQMYIFLPFLFLLAARCSIRTLYVIWFASVIIGIVQPHISGRLNVLSYAPCFIPGVIAWRMIPKCAVKLPGGLWPLGLAASTVVWWFADRQHGMYFRWAFCVLLGATIPFFAEYSSQWLRAICKTVAKYSYGIYLSHLFSMTLAFMLIRNRFAEWSAFCILSFVLPYLMYHLIENPGIRLGKIVANRWSRPKVTIEVPSISERQLSV